MLFFRVIRTKKRRNKSKSDDDFKIDKNASESSSEDESFVSKSSQEMKVDEISNNNNIKIIKERVKQKVKPKTQVYESMTTNSIGSSSHAFVPLAVTPSKIPKKNNLDQDGDLEEIDGKQIPDFIKKEFIRDKYLKRPEDFDYDPSTVDIPEELFAKLTPGMKQYWNIKKDNFDSVVLWRKGDWYIVFYHDISALNTVSEGNPRTFHNEPGFYHNKIDHYTSELIKRGYKVVKVEQTETHEQMKQKVAIEKKKLKEKAEMSKEENGKEKRKETVVGREIAAKYTKGTFLKPLPIEDFLKGKQNEDEELDTKYVLLYIYDEEQNIFGVTYFDITTLQFFIGQFSDDSMW